MVQVLHLPAVAEGVCDLDDGTLAHAVQEKVGLRIEQNRPLELVRPVVIVRKAAQTGLDAADDDGNVRMGTADEVTVDDRGVVGALAHDAAVGVGVGLAAVLADGIVVDHGVHVAAADEEAEPRRAEEIYGIFISPVGLGADGDTVSGVLEDAADDGRSEGGVVDIGITDDKDEVGPIPSASGHIRRANRQKHHIAPVEPKPPSPRRVSESVSASMNFALRKGVTISCAMRSPGSMVWGVRPWLCMGTNHSPR